jgi:hypothetical protein
MLLKIGEVFGHSVDNFSVMANADRDLKNCPFRKARCNKGNNLDPMGICSFSEGSTATVVCPARFQESLRLFADAGSLAFGPDRKVAAIPEIRVLRVDVPGKPARKIGKIDYMLASLDEKGTAMDFAALEVQAVYISGKSIRPAFDHFLKKKALPGLSERRPDFRSSAQKRLMPQLSLKVPVFRRWGKKFFVAVDQTFFDALPAMQTVTDIENSEVTWLVYPFKKNGKVFEMGFPRVVFTLWDEVVAALREGSAPKPGEMLAELQANLQRAHVVTTH